MSRLNLSTSMVCFFLNTANTIANPTAASAAATAITKNTIDCPATSPYAEANVIKDKFTAFSIISIDIKITIALLLDKTPMVPIVNKIADKIK